MNQMFMVSRRPRTYRWQVLGAILGFDKAMQDIHRRSCDEETRPWRRSSTLCLLPYSSISRYVQTSTSAICCRFVLTMRTSTRSGGGVKKKTRRDIRQELQGVAPIKPHELCRFVGLLIARTICPNRDKLTNHWKNTDEGAITRGAFNSVMSRDRFMEIYRNLHFNDNDDP
ncbi:hypothetical protein JG688_00007900 [Phytophthora aleatoria]|uniref:PiggyBac transposable element-derived protein domain-containing protein n=1 Tax=Phytophthora aleatoria TaxID=2496075 RepID=A0A8J5MGB5_9STRA|nr:hypothetical protein JG688_00007900 [Phytophthora aleatoria]